MNEKYGEMTGKFKNGDVIEFRRTGHNGKERWMKAIVAGPSESGKGYRLRVDGPVGPAFVYAGENQMRST